MQSTPCASKGAFPFLSCCIFLPKVMEGALGERAEGERAMGGLLELVLAPEEGLRAGSPGRGPGRRAPVARRWRSAAAQPGREPRHLGRALRARGNPVSPALSKGKY